MSLTRRPLELLLAAKQEISAEIKAFPAADEIKPEDADRKKVLEAALKNIEAAIGHLQEIYQAGQSETGFGLRSR
jgi:hypothetical protein